jgi:hypothetical protein
VQLSAIQSRNAQKSDSELSQGQRALPRQGCRQGCVNRAFCDNSTSVELTLFHAPTVVVIVL